MAVAGLEERFWPKVRPAGPDECWVWQGGKNPKGYGRFNAGTGGANRKMRYPHIVAWELLRGWYPPGLDLDHLCRNHSCVNPWHLDPVSRSENVKRGRAGGVHRARYAAITHCPHGHEYSPENTRYSRIPTGGLARRCKICAARSEAKYRAKKKAQVA